MKKKSYKLRQEQLKYLTLLLISVIFIVLLVIFTFMDFNYMSDLRLLIQIILIILLASLAFYSNRNYNIVKAGIQGEKEMRTILKKIKNQTIYSNIEIAGNNKKGEIDYLCVSSNGLFVVEVKNYAGDIKGKVYDKTWQQIKPKEEKTVDNPLKQLEKEIDILTFLFKQNDIDVKIDGCVYFLKADSIECQDKHIITNEDELIRRIENQSQNYSKDQLKKIKQVIKEL